MALSILFWVRKSAKNSKGFASLKIRLTLPNNDIENFSSDLVVDVKLWNSVKKIVSGNSSDAARVNLYISRSLVKLTDIYSDLQREDRNISAEIIKNIFVGKAQQRLTLLNCLKEHNDQFLQQIEITGKGEVSTLCKFQLLGEKLIKFMEFKYSRKDYFISDLNHSFVQDFRTWLLMYGHNIKEGPLSEDSATGILKKLRKICLNLFKRGLMKSDPFIDTKLRWKNSTAEGLTESDLEKLMKLEVKLPRLQKVLDRFIVGSFSGMSHTDISKCTRDDLVKNYGSEEVWLKVRRKKTNGICKIPLLPPVKAIIDKYANDPKCIAGNMLFPLVGLNIVNTCIKDLAILAGISPEVARNLSSHSSRHGHAQQLLNHGVSILTVSEILGHSNPSITKKIYARNSFFYVAEDMKKFTDKRFPKVKIDGEIQIQRNLQD